MFAVPRNLVKSLGVSSSIAVLSIHLFNIFLFGLFFGEASVILINKK